MEKLEERFNKMLDDFKNRRKEFSVLIKKKVEVIELLEKECMDLSEQYKIPFDSGGMTYFPASFSKEWEFIFDENEEAEEDCFDPEYLRNVISEECYNVPPTDELFDNYGRWLSSSDIC